MPPTDALYHAVLAQLKTVTAVQPVRSTSLVRLALLVTGILAAQSCVLNQVAHELHALGLTRATTAESIARRLRRTLNDARLAADRLYRPALQAALAGQGLAERPLWLVVDESSQANHLHLFRVSLPYWGSSLPIAWALWPQNQPFPAYWPTVAAVFAQVAAWLPPHDDVRVLADRAYDIPAFIDQVAAHGWHWIVRCKARGTLRFRTRQGATLPVKDRVAQHVPGPGHRYKTRGHAFQAAGWREVSLVAVWAVGHDEPLVVLTDLPPSWGVLRDYTRRAWIEPGFRNDKSRGWHWEEAQVQGIAHHHTLLLAVAWASLVVLCLGVQASAQHLQPRPQRRLAPYDHPRASLFTLGRYQVRAWLYQAIPLQVTWHLPDPFAPTWTDRWRATQIQAHLAQSVRP